MIRDILESLHAVVTLHLPGTPEDFLLVLGQDDVAANYMVISGHGDDNGFVFGEFGSNIDTSMLINGSLPASAIAGRANLLTNVLISTACETGNRAFGQAFTAGNVSTYIAPQGEPDGAVVPLFLHYLFFELLHNQVQPEIALGRARAMGGDAKMFVSYTAERADD